VTVTVYRLTKLRYQNQIFSGLGGLYADGRWTFRGHPVIYTSASISLAVLEYTLNYRRRGWVPASVLGRAVIPDKMRIEVVTPLIYPATGQRRIRRRNSGKSVNAGSTPVRRRY
jgi:RES domain-containing protein